MDTGIYKILLPNSRNTYATVDLKKQVFDTRSQRLWNTVQRGFSIPVPDTLRFGHRIKIKLGDPCFLEAFLSIYFRDVLKPMGCKMVEVDEQGQLVDRSGLGDTFSRLDLS